MKRLDKKWQRRADGHHEVLATSPDGTQLAAQWGAYGDTGKAAIWDVATKQIVWEPADATSACWAGDQLLVTRFDAQQKHEVVDWYDARTRERLGSVRVKYPIGAWLTHPPKLVASRRGDLAAVRWMDQSEGGFELLRRGDAGWTQVERWGYYTGSNMLSELMFSDDGDRLALGFGPPLDREWWLEPRDDGTCMAGFIAVLDTTSGGVAFLDLKVQLPKKWKPDPKRSPAPEISSCSRSGVEVELQTGEKRSLSLDGATFELPKS